MCNEFSVYGNHVYDIPGDAINVIENLKVVQE